MKHHSPIIYMIVTAVAAICGFISSGCSDQTAKREKIYLERVDKAVDVYDKLCQAIDVIRDNNEKYIQQMSAKINNGTFVEDEDMTAFEQIFTETDAKLKKLNINQLCDSLSVGSLKDSAEYEKWPQGFKDKVEYLESLLGELRNVGYKIGGFNNRRIVWKNEPWASANSPYYHNLPSIPGHAKEIDEIGHKLEKIIPGTYKSTYIDTTDAKKMESEAINNFDSNRNKAIELFTSAAQKGQPHSMYCLGLIAEDSGDVNAAKKWYKKAAISGSTNAMIKLAQSYYDPMNPKHQTKSKTDRQMAKKWYQRAANFGNPQGVYNMALNYYLGLYDEMDYETANNYCTVGILLHDAKCANLKGALQSDKNEQAKYYRLALTFDPNNRPAKENLRRLGFDM